MVDIRRNSHGSDGIRLDEEGNWFQGDYPILHERTFRYLHKHITQDKEGHYFLTGEDKPIYFTVEDVPYWVVKLERTIVGYLITLTDESIELLDPTTLWTGKKGTLYCLVKGKSFGARFNRGPYYEITKELEEKGNKFFVTIAEKKYPIAQGPPADILQAKAERVRPGRFNKSQKSKKREKTAPKKTKKKSLAKKPAKKVKKTKKTAKKMLKKAAKKKR